MREEYKYATLKVCLATLLLLTGGASYIHSQSRNFRLITTDDGLSQGNVNCILQDSRGFIWFGTQDGLNRYDGSSFSVYRYNPNDSQNISSNNIWALHEFNNILWVGTKSGGVNSINLVTGNIDKFQHSSSDTNTLSNNTSRAIASDHSGVIWVGTDQGLCSIDGKTKKVKRHLPGGKDHGVFTSYEILSLCSDKGNLLWIGTNGGGLCVYNTKTESFNTVSFNLQDIENLFDKDKLSRDKINKKVEGIFKIKDIYNYNDSLLLLATKGAGVVVFNKRSGKYVKLLINNECEGNCISEDDVSSIEIASNGDIWVGINDKGIRIYDAALSSYTTSTYSSSSLNKSIISNSVNVIYKDSRGTMWVGHDEGVSVMKTIFQTYGSINDLNESILNNKVFALLEDRNKNLWVGTMQGFYVLDKNKQPVKLKMDIPPYLFKGGILSMAEDKKGNIWLGTWGNGLVKLDIAANHVEVFDRSNSTLLNQTITDIEEDPTGVLWIGTYGKEAGLYSFDAENKAFTRYSTNNGLKDNNIYCLHINKKGQIWVGTEKGGLMMKDQGSALFFDFVTLTGGKSLSSEMIRSITEDKDGNVWCATSLGLNQYKPNKKEITVYGQKDGLPSDELYAVLEDNMGNLWISHSQGLSELNLSSIGNSTVLFRNFNEYHGLQGKDFNQGAYFKSSDGELFFGGINGFNSFYPEQLDIDHNFHVFITSFKQDGEEVKFDSLITVKNKLDLSWEKNSFEIEFSALEYTFPSKNRYSYILEGVDKDWSPLSNRPYAKYSNLKGGHYTFRVRAYDSAGILSDSMAVLYISLETPFWETIWFYIVVGILFMLLVIAVFRFRVKSIQREKKILEEKVKERTVELAQKNLDITSSIKYAKRIQEAILPDFENIKKAFPDSFILFRPKDIVSGDFYWFGEKDGKKLLAVVDCTGHGVPGAFMSMIGHTLLNQIVFEKGIVEPHLILQALSYEIQQALNQSGKSFEANDGMDAAICVINADNSTLLFSGAMRPLFMVSEGRSTKISGDKFSIGGIGDGKNKIFTPHIIKIKKGDCIYMFSDGFQDQFGGEKGKKFMLKRLCDALTLMHGQDMTSQGKMMEDELNEWQGEYQQVDDILLVGLSFR